MTSGEYGLAMLPIIENREDWLATFTAGWLKQVQETGEVNWKLYNRPNNKTAPSGKGISLSEAKLILISTAGGYLRDSQIPFDAENDLGDYTIRTFPTSTPLEAVDYAHTHYDHTAVNSDPQVLLPLRHLEGLVADGTLGSVSDTVISFMGYQPNIMRVEDELIPAIREVIATLDVNSALLVPS